MKLGPNQIVACPHCGALAHYRTLVSGNTLGAEGWTDGRQYAPMMVEPPAVVKCHACAKCYWLADAEEIGVVERDFRAKEPVPEAWRNAAEVKEPNPDEYLDAIEAGLAKDGAQEKSLRLLAWWRSNDAARGWPFVREDTPVASPDGVRRNLERMLDLLTDDNDNDRLMRAEVLRELGEFAAAEQALREVSTDLRWVVEQIRSLCAAKDTRVRMLEVGRKERRTGRSPRRR
jgi:hypothetical protein